MRRLLAIILSAVNKQYKCWQYWQTKTKVSLRRLQNFRLKSIVMYRQTELPLWYTGHLMALPSKIVGMPLEDSTEVVNVMNSMSRMT